MINKNLQVHHKTPVVTVQDNRMLTVRDIHYHCQPDHIDDRITRYRFNAPGSLSTSIDPRLAELQQSNQAINPNFTYLSSLTGDVLRTDSVDADATRFWRNQKVDAKAIYVLRQPVSIGQCERM